MSGLTLIPASAIIPTYNRVKSLNTTLETLALQHVQFKEIIVIDASEDRLTERLCHLGVKNLQSDLVYLKAIKKGAASQRNEGFSLAKYPFIAFMDDDVYLEEFCLERLWNCFTVFPDTGGVSAMITNQKYEPLGRLTKTMCRIINGKPLDSYAGKCIGPAWNFLPADDVEFPDYTRVDWLNLGLTIYRKEVLPMPPFQSHFTGYSMMEDLTLSLTVGKNWPLYNARTARIFHDSQPGAHKSNVKELEKMELINRYFIMTQILNRNRLIDLLKLGLLELFKLTSLFSNKRNIAKVPSAVVGKIAAIISLIRKPKISLL